MRTNINHQQLLNIADIMFIAIDNKGIVTLANKKACKILEYQESEIVGKKWIDNFVPEDTRKNLIAVSKKIFSDELDVVEHFENPVLTKSGEEKIISWHNTTVRNENGRIIGHLSSGTEITQQIEKDRKLQELSLIIERSKSIAFIWRNQENWPVEYVSKNVNTIIGYTADDFLSGKLVYSQIIHSDDLERVSQEVKHNSKSNIKSFIHEPYRIIGKNKQITWVNDETFIRRNIKGEITHYEGIIHDITDIKKIEESLRASEQELLKTNKTKDKFFSIIAHDLRSPFSAILGLTSILMTKHKEYDIEKREKIIKSLNNSANSTFSLLENLLTWSHSQTGQISYLPEKLHLKILLSEVMLSLQAVASNKNIQVLDTISENALIFADKNMIGIVLRNLISNAIKFTNSGGTIIISSKNLKERNFYEISVADTGVGIPKEKIDDLFRIEKNTSTQGTEKETGTGLGLILCSEFVKKHNGKISVESEINKGSKFIITLPNIL